MQSQAQTGNQPAPQAARYALTEPAPPATTDQALVLRVRVENNGARRWPTHGPHPVHLSYHWYDSTDRLVDFEGLRSALPNPLDPGESAEVELLVEPPPEAGEYRLAIDLVEEGIGWFMHLQVEPLLLPLAVSPPDRYAPRVCIINGNCVINDAVGNHLLNQLQFFLRRGYRPLLLLEHVDLRQPIDLRRYMAQVDLHMLSAGSNNPQTRRAVLHFQSSDLFIVHYSTYYKLAEAIRQISRGIVIFDYHGVTPPWLWEGQGREQLEAGQRNLDLVRYADYAIGHSSFTRGELIKTGQIAPERVWQMGYAVPLQRFTPGPRPTYLAERYGIAADQPVLLYVGRMAANKRVGDLVEALAIVHGQLPGVKLLLVGDNQLPPYARIVAAIRSRAAELGLADHVIFTGQIPDAELPDHYRLANVFVTASVHEGFCIPVLEAMACGRPAVGANTTALPETIGPGGLTFEPQNPAALAQRLLELLGTLPVPSAASAVQAEKPSA